MFEVLDPAKLTLANETSYKFNDMFTLKKESKFYTTVYGMNFEAPKYLNSLRQKNEKASMFGLSSKLSAEFKPTSEVKLLANVLTKFENGKYNGKNVRNEESFEVKAEAKSEFESQIVKGLKSDAKLVYGYTKKAEGIEKIKYKGLSKKHSFELDSNSSYAIDLTNGFELTPAFNLNYKFNVNNVYDILIDENGLALLKTNTFTVKPNAKLAYKFDKFTTSLKLESPFEFSSKSLETKEDDAGLVSIVEVEEQKQSTISNSIKEA